MEFNIVQKMTFNARRGSYSIVTERELYDSQITATDAEAELLASYFSKRGESIYTGNVRSSRGASGKIFKLFPHGENICLNLVYPKPGKSELRLYLSQRAGFFPNSGDVWFLFISNDNSLWIGAMPERIWRQKNSLGRKDDDSSSDSIFDEIDSTIIEKLNGLGVPAMARTVVQTWRISESVARRRCLAVTRMMQTNFLCEFDSSHQLFTAKATGKPYLEAHHIIPVAFQDNFPSKPLDSINNICCLCPFCHRALHHAEGVLVRRMLTRIAETRNIAANFNLSTRDLYRLYAVEDILRT